MITAGGAICLTVNLLAACRIRGDLALDRRQRKYQKAFYPPHLSQCHEMQYNEVGKHKITPAWTEYFSFHYVEINS